MFSIPEPLILLAVLGGLLQFWSRTGALRAAIRPTAIMILFLSALLHGIEGHFSVSWFSSLAARPATVVDDVIRQAVWLSYGLGGVLLALTSDREAVNSGLVLLAIAALGAIACGDSVLWLVVGLQVVGLAAALLVGAVDGDDQQPPLYGDLLLMQTVCLALFVFGVGLLFAQIGTLSLGEMRSQMAIQVSQTGSPTQFSPAPAVATAVLIMTGLIGLVFSVWLPWGTKCRADEGGFGVAAAVSLIPVLAVVLTMLRLFPGVLAGWHSGVLTVVMLAALMMIGVGLLAVWLQTNLRGMLGWACVVHAGLWTAVLTAACWDALHPDDSLVAASGLPGGFAATALALVCDTAALLGVWSVLSWLAGGRDTLRQPDELCGLLRMQPLAGAVLSLCLLSLCGAPFLAGFWGRLWSLIALFGPRQSSSLTGLYEPHFGFLFLVAVSAAGQLLLCGLYLRLLQRIVLEHPLGRIRLDGRRSAFVCATLIAAVVLLVGIRPAPLMRAVTPASTPAAPSVEEPVPGGRDDKEPETPTGGIGGQQAVLRTLRRQTDAI